MHKTLFVLSVTSVMLALSGCAATAAPTAAQVTLDPAVGRTVASSLTAAVTSAEADDGVGIAAALGATAETTAGLIAATRAASQAVVAGSSASTTCTCATAARSCTFSACTIGKAVVSGTLSWAAGVITSDKLSFAVPETSASLGAVNVGVDGKLTYGPGTLAGSLHLTGDADVEQVKYTWDATIRPNDVTFASSAFTGGSIDLAAKVTAVSVTRGTESYAGSAVVSLP